MSASDCQRWMTKFRFHRRNTLCAKSRSWAACATATHRSLTNLTASILNSRLTFRLVISTLQFLGHDRIFGSTKPAEGQGWRIVSVAAIIALAASTEGRRDIIGLGIGPSEAETFWTDFLHSLKARGLDGVKLVISGAHTGLKSAIARVFEATWQRYRVHWMRNALAYVSKASIRSWPPRSDRPSTSPTASTPARPGATWRASSAPDGPSSPI